MWSGKYYDPFYGCTELIAMAQPLNMTVKEYLLHQNRVTRRIAVLICLKRINDKRIKDSEEAKRRKLDDGDSSSSSRSGGDVVFGSGDSISGNSSNARVELNGVLAEEKIPPFEMWREMVMFL